MGEFNNAEQLVEFDDEGRLHADEEILSQLRHQRFQLHMEGDTVTLTAQPEAARPAAAVRRLSEIEELGERSATLDSLLRLVARPGATHLPEGWDSRENIYD